MDLIHGPSCEGPRERRFCIDARAAGALSACPAACPRSRRRRRRWRVSLVFALGICVRGKYACMAVCMAASSSSRLLRFNFRACSRSKAWCNSVACAVLHVVIAVPRDVPRDMLATQGRDLTWRRQNTRNTARRAPATARLPRRSCKNPGKNASYFYRELTAHPRPSKRRPFPTTTRAVPNLLGPW